jgi:uncharacterized protein (TIGR03435 family)
MLATAALGQQVAEKTAEFEVASIKPSPPPGPGGGRGPANDPTLFAARSSSLRRLITRAYAVEEYQVAGGPAWTETDLYDIDARPESPSSSQEMLLMLRSLLSDRFQLKFHRETRPIQLNVLSVTKGGPRFGPEFHPAKEGDPPSNLGKQSINHLTFPGLTIQRFSTYLRLNMMRDPETNTTVGLQDVPPILDETGLTGRYDIILNADSHEAWSATLEHQLGLKVEVRKVPTEIIVIDSAVKPSGN